jgi:hypothetical protein
VLTTDSPIRQPTDSTVGSLLLFLMNTHCRTLRENPSRKQNGPIRHFTDWAAQFNPGDDRLSHAVARAVPWALEGLTSVFGMGTGVTPPV